MNTHLQHIINQLRTEGKDYTLFKELLYAIKASGAVVSKDEILEFVADDYRIQLHTTSNSIAMLIAHIAQCGHPKCAIDICCGTGNILYYLQKEIEDLTGVEIVKNVAELTKYIIPRYNIITADSFLYPFQRKYDLVVGNIPFGMRIEMNGKRMSGEEAFLRKAQELMTDNGKSIMLVPYSMLLSTQFHNFRNDFVNYLQEIIALPLGKVRNTQIKTALLVFSKQATKEIKLTKLQQFENLNKEYEGAEHTIFSNEQLMERWDPEYHLTRENSFYKELDNFQTKELQEMAEIIKGKIIPVDSLQQQGDYLYLKPSHIQNNRLNFDCGLKYVAKEVLSEKDYRYILQPGDIVISTIFNDLKMYVYKSGDFPAFASNNMAIIRSSIQDYIHSYLQTEDGKRVFKTQAEDLRKGITIPHLTLKDLAGIKIPILPLSDLNSIGNQSISIATSIQLEEALVLLKVYKKQIEDLKQDNANSLKSFIDDRFNRIESQISIVNQKLDNVLDVLKELKTDFDTVRVLPREDDEKLFKLCQKIDNKFDIIYSNEKINIESYVKEIKRWLNQWELLDTQSKKFLPIAEFIFDELSKIPDADYAPFVVQYCRSFENEVLKKLFESYHTVGLKDIDRNRLVQNDIDHPKTGKFALMVKKNKMTYTLGDMNFIMSLLKQGGHSLNESSLLKDFRNFTILYFDEQIVEAKFLKDIEKLTNDFRNKAAHPYSIGIDTAKQCQELLRKCLNVFLESIRNSNE